MKYATRLLALSAAAALLPSGAMQAQALPGSTYHVVKTIKLP